MWYKVLGYEPAKDGNDKEYVHVINNYKEAVKLVECWRYVWGFSPVFIEETTIEHEVR